MQITEQKYFHKYNELIGNQIDDLILKFNFEEKTTELGYNNASSAVYSSNIEGNSIDLNSFMNYKFSQDKFKRDKDIQEIENLVLAYEFVQANELNEKNFLFCHKILSKTLVLKSKQGKYRSDKVGVFGQSGLIYLAIEPEFVKQKMKDFFLDIKSLLEKKLTSAEAFYFASMIHLKFVNIHPFSDGNGRVARLLEKWFLAEKLGKEFWKISSEKYYKNQQNDYYNNINLGVNYYELNYDKCIPFLVMLPNCLLNN